MAPGLALSERMDVRHTGKMGDPSGLHRYPLERIGAGLAILIILSMDEVQDRAALCALARRLDLSFEPFARS